MLVIVQGMRIYSKVLAQIASTSHTVIASRLLFKFARAFAYKSQMNALTDALSIRIYLTITNIKPELSIF